MPKREKGIATFFSQTRFPLFDYRGNNHTHPLPTSLPRLRLLILIDPPLPLRSNSPFPSVTILPTLLYHLNTYSVLYLARPSQQCLSQTMTPNPLLPT